MNKKIFLYIGFFNIVALGLIAIISKMLNFSFYYTSDNSLISLFILVMIIITMFFLIENIVHFWKNSNLNTIYKILIIIISIILQLIPVILYFIVRIKNKTI
mgnify:FL=1